MVMAHISRALPNLKMGGSFHSHAVTAQRSDPNLRISSSLGSWRPSAQAAVHFDPGSSSGFLGKTWWKLQDPPYIMRITHTQRKNMKKRTKTMVSNRFPLNQCIWHHHIFQAGGQRQWRFFFRGSGSPIHPRAICRSQESWLSSLDRPVWALGYVGLVWARL